MKRKKNNDGAGYTRMWLSSFSQIRPVMLQKKDTRWQEWEKHGTLYFYFLIQEQCARYRFYTAMQTAYIFVSKIYCARV